MKQSTAFLFKGILSSNSMNSTKTNLSRAEGWERLLHFCHRFVAFADKIRTENSNGTFLDYDLNEMPIERRLGVPLAFHSTNKNVRTTVDRLIHG